MVPLPARVVSHAREATLIAQFGNNDEFVVQLRYYF
jgi:hypothetical protein